MEYIHLEDTVRTKTIFLSLFIGILFLAAGSALYAATTDLNHATQITWESVHEPFFNKYNPYGPGARAMGMAESFAAIADDASAVYYNPSGLAQMNFNEVMWTGGSLYGNGPYTGFLTCVIALGTQYFGLSYTKLYHPTGWYPDNIQIPSDYPTAGDGGINNPTGSGLFPNNPDGVWMPANVYPDWFESISDARKDFLSGIYREFINRPFQEDQVMLTYATPLTGDKSFMFGTASSSWNCTASKPSFLYSSSFFPNAMLSRTGGPKGSAPSWMFQGPKENLNVPAMASPPSTKLSR